MYNYFKFFCLQIIKLNKGKNYDFLYKYTLYFYKNNLLN